MHAQTHPRADGRKAATTLRRLAPALTAFAAAATLNTANVALEQRYRLFTRGFGARGWYLHLALVLPAWTAAVWQIGRADERVRWPLPRATQPLGMPLLVVAGGLWGTAFAALGPTRTGNGNLFGYGSQEPVTGGVFRLRANPMYDSYVLALVGLALQRRNAVYLLLAGEALTLLHGLEARVENRPIVARAQMASAYDGAQKTFLSTE